MCRTRTGGTCNHAALCSTVIRYRAKGALRDVGKSLGLTEDLIKMLSSQVWGWSEEGVEAKHAEELNLNLEDRRLKLAIVLARELIGTPRHLSQHPGGFVLTHDRLDELVPIEPAAMPDRQVIEWDKDDIDALKFMKVDCLAFRTDSFEQVANLAGECDVGGYGRPRHFFENGAQHRNGFPHAHPIARLCDNLVATTRQVRVRPVNSCSCRLSVGALQARSARARDREARATPRE